MAQNRQSRRVNAVKCWFKLESLYPALGTPWSFLCPLTLQLSLRNNSFTNSRLHRKPNSSFLTVSESVRVRVLPRVDMWTWIPISYQKFRIKKAQTEVSSDYQYCTYRFSLVNISQDVLFPIHKHMETIRTHTTKWMAWWWWIYKSLMLLLIN